MNKLDAELWEYDYSCDESDGDPACDRPTEFEDFLDRLIVPDWYTQNQVEPEPRPRAKRRKGTGEQRRRAEFMVDTRFRIIWRLIVYEAHDRHTDHYLE